MFINRKAIKLLKLDLKQVDGIIESKMLEVLKVLDRNKNQIMSIKMISDDSKIPMTTAFRIIHSLENKGWVNIVTIGKVRFYRANKKKFLDAIKLPKLDLKQVDGIIESKMLEVLKVLDRNKNQIMSIKMISDDSKIPMTTAFRIIHSLENKGWVDIVTIGKVRFYRANKKKFLIIGKNETI